MATPRDTQFKDFAKLLITELHALDAQNWRSFILQAEPIVARRAYDLVHETVQTIYTEIGGEEVEESYPTPDACIRSVTMTELPVECECGDLAGGTNLQTGKSLCHKCAWKADLEKFQ